MKALGSCVIFGVLATAALAQTPIVSDGGVVDAASFSAGRPVAPGSIVSIFGTDLASQLAQASTIPLSTELDNISVTFNNVPAPLFAVTPIAGQPNSLINAQLPWDVLPPGMVEGTVPVVVTRNGVQSAPVNVQVAAVGPGIFAFPVNGRSRAIAIFLDGALAWETGELAGIVSRPARAGDVLQILANGLGQVDVPVIGNGYDSHDRLRNTIEKATVLLGGTPLSPDDVLFSGLAPTLVGVNQVNIKIPVNAPKGSVVSLQVQIGGVTSAAEVSIAIE